MENDTRQVMTVINTEGTPISTQMFTPEQCSERTDLVAGEFPVPPMGQQVRWNGELWEFYEHVPAPELATWEVIKTYRNTFEQAELDTPHGLLDVDLVAMERLCTAVKQFLFLPTVEDGKLAWKMADNTIQLFNYIELKALFEEADRLRSVRAAYLHKRAEELAAMDPAPEVDFVADINNWIEP